MTETVEKHQRTERVGCESCRQGTSAYGGGQCCQQDNGADETRQPDGEGERRHRKPADLLSDAKNERIVEIQKVGECLIHHMQPEYTDEPKPGANMALRRCRCVPCR